MTAHVASLFLYRIFPVAQPLLRSQAQSRLLQAAAGAQGAAQTPGSGPTALRARSRRRSASPATILSLSIHRGIAVPVAPRIVRLHLLSYSSRGRRPMT